MTVIGLLSSKHLLWCICGGVLLTCVYGFYVRGVLGRFVRALIENKAFSEGAACTAEELECTGILYKFALRKKSSFVEQFKTVGDEPRFYIAPEDEAKLTAKYGENDVAITSLLLTLCAFILVAFIISAFLPQIELLLKGLFS